MEAKIIRDKADNSHKGCAFLRCMYFHEAEFILKLHKNLKIKKGKAWTSHFIKGKRPDSKRSKHRSVSSSSSTDKEKSESGGSEKEEKCSKEEHINSYFDEKSSKTLKRL